MRKSVIFALGCAAFLSAACTSKNNLDGNNQSNQPSHTVQVKNTNLPNSSPKNNQQAASRLVHIVENVPKVKGAAAVVFAGYALVGIDVDAHLDRSEVGSIKYSAAESIKNDPYGANAIVVADPDTNARIREIADDIKRGKTGQGIVNELADIAGRLMPEIPQNLTEVPKPERTQQKTDTGLNKKQQNNLDIQQEKQSNGHK